MKKKPTIGKAESEVLRFIAERGGATVTEVGDYLAETKGQTRNTALNMMERLRHKGFVARTKENGVYRYLPAQEKESLLQSLVADFVDGILGGSVAPLVAYLSSKTELNEAQIEELKKLINSPQEPPK